MTLRQYIKSLKIKWYTWLLEKNDKLRATAGKKYHKLFNKAKNARNKVIIKFRKRNEKWTKKLKDLEGV